MAGGAVALVVDHRLPVSCPQLVVGDVRAATPHVAAAVWGHPAESLASIGVTGTNGKTTVVALCAQLLRRAGRDCEVVGTLTGARTTPESTDLQRTLRDAVDRGVDAVAMEVSSHALALGRVDGLTVDVAVFTNLGTDHLDFHGTPERYFEAKSRLFDPTRCRSAIVNVDDVHGRLLFDAALVPTTGVSIEGLADLEVGGAGSRFRWRDHEVTLPLLGRFNVTNALLAAEATLALGVRSEVVAEALAHVTPPPGRMQPVVAGQPFAVIVDFAHTPDALEQLLETSRVLDSGRVIVVFGCGGDRDPTKRPLMGQVASTMADLVVLTSDNPRSEDPSTIMAAVQAGMVGDDARLVPDRREAITLAVRTAQPSDIVVIAGKGHEQMQIIGDRELPFDDVTIAREALAHAGWVAS